jgi:hypothetical protein
VGYDSEAPTKGLDMAKLPAGTRGWIVKLYKTGTDIGEIHQKVKQKLPKITKDTIRRAIRKHLVDVADELWSTAVKVRGGLKCAISNKTENVESHHLIRRGNWTHRYTLMNGIPLNSYFHTLGDKIAAHGATDVTERFRAWMQESRPEQWAWFQKHLNDPSKKPELDEMLIIIKRLEAEIKDAYHMENNELGVRQKPTRM